MPQVIDRRHPQDPQAERTAARDDHGECRASVVYLPVNAFLALSGAVTLLFGLAFFTAPDFTLGVHGLPAEAANRLLARFFGAALLPLGLLGLLMRRVRDDGALKAVLVANAAGWAVGFMLSYAAVSTGREGRLGWLMVAIDAVFLLYSIYYLSSPARRG